MTVLDHAIHTLQGDPTSLDAFRGKALLVVNVASKCGLTPQYTGLEELQQQYGERGFSVIASDCRTAGSALTFSLWESRPWPAHRCRSIVMRLHNNLASTKSVARPRRAASA